jgi:hypothetical protein
MGRKYPETQAYNTCSSKSLLFRKRYILRKVKITKFLAANPIRSSRLHTQGKGADGVVPVLHQALRQ